MRLDWRRAALYAAIVGIEGSWLYALLALANQHAVQERLSVSGLIVLYPAAFFFNSFLERLGWHRALRVLVSWLAWAAALLLMVKAQLFPDVSWSDSSWASSVPRAVAGMFEGFSPELLVLLASILMWWLGRRLARGKPGFRLALAEFQFGLAIIVLTYFCASQFGVSMGEAVPTALAFFVFSLVGISIGHAQEGASWLAGHYRGHWATLLLASIGVVVALGWLIGSYLSPDLLGYILDGLKWLWGVFVQGLTYLASLLPHSEPGELPAPSPLPGASPGEDSFAPWSLSEVAQERLRVVWTMGVLGVAAFALWRVSSQIVGWMRRKLAGSDAETEPMPGAFRADLLALLRLLWGRLSALRLFRRRAAPVPETASVRQVYRQLLRWAAANGCPRGRSETPYELLEALAGALPQARAELSFVTEQYVRARYSPAPPGADELDELKLRWRIIKKARIKKSEDRNRS